MAWMSVVLSAVLATNVPAGQAPAGPSAQERAMVQFWADVARDGSPRERALVARMPLPGEAPGGGKSRTGRQLRAAAGAAPADELVQWLWASAPPDLSGCDASDPCPGRAMALARLTPDNALAWLPVVDHAIVQGDRTGASEALARMAAASRYDEPIADFVAAWADLLRRHPLPARAMLDDAGVPLAGIERDNAESVMAIAVAAAMVMPVQGLYKHCDAKASPVPAPGELASCRQVAGLMLDSQTIVQRMLGSGLMRRAGAAVDPAFERQRQWWTSAHQLLDENPHEFHRYVEDLRSTRSEIRAIELLLHRAGRPLSPPADWVYVSPWDKPKAQ